MAKPTVVPEDEAVDAREMTGGMSIYCSRCKELTDHAMVIRIRQGFTMRVWRCLRCGHTHK